MRLSIMSQALNPSGYTSAAEYYEDGPLRVVVVFNTSQIMFVPQGINESQTITGDNSVKSWFAGSKVVNPDGSPKLMYRGDENQIDSFDRSFDASISSVINSDCKHCILVYRIRFRECA